MKKTMRIRVLAVAFAATLALMLGATAASAGVSDAWITTKAKISLLTTRDVSASDVSVDTIDGKVTLHGTVPTEADKTRAAAVVKNIDGVKSLDNLLQVVPQSQSAKVEAKDDEIKSRVEDALASDKDIQGSDITVASVNDGVVLLKGKADSMSDHLEALNDARKVAGVKRVESEIAARDRLGDGVASNAESTANEAKGAMAQAGTTAGDMWITSATKARLLADGNTPALDINVDTNDGVVTLFGIVPTEASKADAEVDARKVSGVKSVRNQLQVVSAKNRSAVEAKDADIKKSVEQTFAKNPKLDDRDIDVNVKDGVVRLTGSVQNQDERLAAGFAARSVPGVRSVLVNDLQVAG